MDYNRLVSNIKNSKLLDEKREFEKVKMEKDQEIKSLKNDLEKYKKRIAEQAKKMNFLLKILKDINRISCHNNLLTEKDKEHIKNFHLGIPDDDSIHVSSFNCQQYKMIE